MVEAALLRKTAIAVNMDSGAAVGASCEINVKLVLSSSSESSITSFFTVVDGKWLDRS